jgi:DNA/RNA-binding domain of Phe-tRNA-synthetase-like protein
MYFCHSSEIWKDYPELVPGVLFAKGITKDASVGSQITKFNTIAESRLATNSEGELPEIQAWRRVFSDLCNAISLAFAIPVAVFDVSKIAEYIEVRYAGGTEDYLAFSGETENPEAHEVVFADSAGRAHARRWTNRQSAYSAIRDETTAALIVAEALHGSAFADVQKLTVVIADELGVTWSITPKTKILNQSSSRFEF